MGKELRAAGHDVVFVSAHGYTADTLEEQEKIYSRMTYPLLQEKRGASLRDLWDVTDRSDIYMFSRTGVRLEHLKAVKDVATDAGYAKLKATLLGHLTAK